MTTRQTPASSGRTRWLGWVWLQRGLLLLSQLSLALPMVVVHDCSGDDSVVHSGLDVYGTASTTLRLGALQLALALLLFVWVWRGPAVDAAHAAAGLGLRASLSVVGLITALVTPPLAFILDSVEPRLGWLLHGGAWAALAVGFVVGALRRLPELLGNKIARAERVGLGLVVGAPLLSGCLGLVRGYSGVLIPTALALTVALPLAMAALGVGGLTAAAASDRAAWRVALWTAVGLWCLVWVGVSF